MVNPFFKSAFLAATLLSLNCCYLAKQGFYTVKYTIGAKSIEEAVQNKRVDDSLATLFKNVRSIKKYSVENIGLADNSNYTRFIRIEKGYLIDLFAVSKTDTFKFHEWWFPFFGRTPHLGYFKRKDALRQAENFKKKGYDIIVVPVDAFSTLGIVSDPVYSFMKKLTLYQLAYLIFHEQTHATIFLKNQMNFNEELASFVGETGAMAYIKERFGETSAEYQQALREKEDSETWDRELRELHATLDTVYVKRWSREEKIHRKKEIIDSFKTVMNDHNHELFRTDAYRNMGTLPINNAYLGLHMTYSKDLSLFYGFFRKNNNDIKSTVTQLKILRNSKLKDPKEVLRRELQPPREPPPL
jgi:predicted aminopeptidase